MNAHEEALYAPQHLSALRRLLAELLFRLSGPAQLHRLHRRHQRGRKSLQAGAGPGVQRVLCLLRRRTALQRPPGRPPAPQAPGGRGAAGRRGGQPGYGAERHSRADGRFVGRQRPAAVAGVDAHDQVRGRPDAGRAVRPHLPQPVHHHPRRHAGRVPDVRIVRGLAVGVAAVVLSGRRGHGRGRRAVDLRHARAGAHQREKRHPRHERAAGGRRAPEGGGRFARAGVSPAGRGSLGDVRPAARRHHHLGTLLPAGELRLPRRHLHRPDHDCAAGQPGRRVCLQLA